MANRKGFTLIELLIVIAILAILAAAVLIVINPAELLRRSRDSKRITDLDSLKSAVNLFIVNSTSTPDLTNDNAAKRCRNGSGVATLFYSLPSGSGIASTTALSSFTWTTGSTTLANLQGIGGSGWMPINFSTIPGGSPLAVEPIDPSNSYTANTTDLYYTYACDASDSTFEFTANMESKVFSSGGSNDVESKDGGPVNTIYEVGTKLTIIDATASTATSSSFYGSQ